VSLPPGKARLRRRLVAVSEDALPSFPCGMALVPLGSRLG
jgi:hypothetical protein